MFAVGPYEFTESDAKRTVLHAQEVFDLYGRNDDAALIEHLRPAETCGDLAEDLAAVWTSWTAAGPALRAAGRLPARAEGRVVQLNVSAGGVPKHAVDSAEVTWKGLAGDRQATRLHHGRPWQALCIWSAEVIADFQRDGHPLAAGKAGENITVRGLPWAEVRPGARLRIGTVLCEVSCYSLPCSNNAPWFRGGDFRLMHHERGPVSRVYATVLEPGHITTGDPAILEP